MSNAGFTELNFNGKTILVMNDYYQEGGIRMPLGLTRAFAVADSLGCRLPTKEEVDFIYQKADIKLQPIFMSPTSEMTSYSYFQRHNSMIEDQLAGQPAAGKLIAGHKKDILDTPRNSSRVKIYGWHQLNGAPVQPVSTVHHREYADYSHGLRLVKL